MRLRFSTILCTLALLLWGVQAFCNDPQHKGQVLVISSYTPLRENGTQTIAAFTEALTSRANYRVTVEYMDCEASREFGQWTQWMGQLFQAFVKKPVAVVIIGPEAWSAYSASCPADWKDIPVILGNVRDRYVDYSNYAPDKISDAKDVPLIKDYFGDFRVTGYYIQDHLHKDLQLIRRLQPQVRHVVFLYDDRYSMYFFPRYVAEIASKAGFEDMIYLSGEKMSTAQVLDSISAMDDTYALFSAGWYSDSTHYQHAYSMLNNELSWDPGKFIYMAMDLGFTNANELGGYYVSGREIGRDLGELTYRVLTDGIENAPPFGPSPSSPRYHINYRTMVAAGLDPALAPEGTVFYNRETSLFRDYIWETLLVSMLFLALLAILFIVAFHRKKQERIYIKANARMKRLIGSMPDMAVICDAHLNIQEVINPRTDISPDSLIGWHVSQLQDHPDYQDSGSIIAENIRRTAATGQSCTFQYKIDRGGRVFYLDARSAPYGKGVICFVHDATPYVSVKQEVEKLQAFLQSVVNDLPVGLHVKDVSDGFRYVLCNEKANMFFHGDTAPRLGRNDFEAGAAVAQEYRQDDLKTLESDVPLTFDRYLYDDQGNLIRCGMATKSKLVTSDGACYIITVLVDLTEDRKKESELYSARKKLAIALDAGALAAWSYNPEKKWFYSLHNRTISGDGFTLENAFALLHPDDLASFTQMIRRLTDGEIDKTREILRFKREGVGRYEWFEVYATAIKDPQGKVVQIVGTEKDITQSVEDERKLKEYIFKLEMVTRSGGFVQWDYDVSTRKFSSPDKESFLYSGVSREQFMQLVYPEDVSLVSDSLEKLIDGRMESVTVEARVNIPGEGLRWMSMHAVVFARDGQGRVTTITGLRKDVSEMRNITQELIALRDKAEESNRLKSAFLANMSHEIRTPLNAIVGFSGLIMESDDKEQAQEYYEIVQTNNELLLQLINDILDLSKIESGQLEFIYDDVDICVILRQLEQIYRYKVKPEVEVICELPEESCIIHSEKNRLTQVLSNFLNNAVKFTSQGSIRMGYQYAGDNLRFYVTDTGKGIAKENIPNVFVRFMKFDSFVQGTGLGLSICDVIVKNLGGDIGVESILGEGSTFWFTLPLQRCKPKNEITDCQNDPVVEIMEETNRPRGKSILVAEDNDSNYLLLSSILKKDYQLTRAANGQQAVQLYGEISPDIILMDIKMPVMDGLEATAEIRKTDKDIPIIALTAYAFDSDREAALNAGCNLVMTKPVDIKGLRQVLTEILGS